MIDSTRLRHGRRTVVVAPPQPASSVTDRWAETLAVLARSHQARLRAPDPSRPWLSGEVSPDSPEITRAAKPAIDA